MKLTLQTRIMGTFLVIVAVLAGVAAMIFANARTSADAYQRSLSDLLRVTELTRAVDRGADLLGNLATDPFPDRVAGDFKQINEQIHQLRLGLPASSDPNVARLVQDLDSMADSFMIEASAAIYAFRAEDMERYFEHDREAALIAGYVRDTADRLLAAELEAYRRVYPEVTRRNQVLQDTNVAVLAAVTLLAIVFAWSFAHSVTDPLLAFSRAAGRIAGGDLEGPAVPSGFGVELEVLGGAFNHMQENLRQYVAELKGKAELERRLRAEEMVNLQNQTLLREAELRMLQSQVHPHFLFNTLNMIARTALIEGADRTRSLMETTADLLRYNLRQLDRPVTLADEVDQVQRYMAIQQERFRERIRFCQELDESLLWRPIPCLTLQPLVENALIHGIGAREEGGTVELTIQRTEGGLQIQVADDGVGINPERLAELNLGGRDASGAAGHTTGLGLHSVKRRLELFFGDGVGFMITARSGGGSVVVMDLPAPAERVQTGAHSGSR